MRWIVASVLTAPSLGAQGLPLPPSQLTGPVAGTSVTLTWYEARGAERYVVEVGSAHALTNLGTFDTSGAATTCGATSVPSGVDHVRVRAGNSAGVSGPSTEITLAVGATCLLPTVSNLAIGVVNGLANITWSSTNATSHRLEAVRHFG